LQEGRRLRLVERRGFAAGTQADKQRIAELDGLVDRHLKRARPRRDFINRAQDGDVHFLHLPRGGNGRRATCENQNSKKSAECHQGGGPVGAG
jgi:hypothetical protein